MSIVDEKRARGSTESRRNRNIASPRYRQTPEVLVTDGFGTPTSLPHTIDPELGAEEEVPPAYSEHHDQLSLHHNGFDAGAVVTDDGRVNINLNQTSRLLAHSLRDQLKADARVTAESPLPPAYIPPSLGGQPGQTPPPKLNVVIQIVGSRGDIQPFIALGKVLRDTYGHRVRLATHPVFQKFVEDNGLEFFSIGGDPAELMAFMVKNPGLMPGFEAVKSGEVTKRRKGIEQIILGCWRSCIETGKGLGPAPSFSRMERDYAGLMPDSYDPLNKPFVADAIIANPPSFAHIHVAEKLGVPLHLMFTSPALIPKPIDWGQNIDVAGFYFLNLASSFTPEPELAAFLAAGPPPIYIGFGSIVVDDPNGLTRTIFDAVAETGVRALVSKGWGGLGADDVGIPEGVFMLGNVPHDWLFNHVSAVCHHGGAGTTAAGINAGKPTIVVPFFGDQPFWGAMVARAGAGPDPIPYKKLTSEGLAEAIRIVMKPETQERAQELGAKIREEKGTDIGAQSFHRHLDTDHMRCSVVPSRTAVWRVRRTQTLLSALAAATLVQLGYLQYSDLKLFRVKEYNTQDHPTDPISAVTSAFVGDIASIGLSVADFPRDIFKAARGRPKPHEVSEDAGDNATVATNMDASSVALTEVTSGATVTTAAEDLPVAELDSGADRRAEAESESTRQPRKLRLKPGNDATGGLTLSFSSDTLPNPDDVVPAQRQRAASSPETPHRAGSPHNSGPTSPPQDHDKLERVIGAGKSVNNIVATGMRSPMNFCMGLAKGFRNLPKLYNDDTVRPPEKVKGIGSGLKIAGKEFGFGMYDGISGLVTQPYRGAQKQGALGLVKGFGKGIGGLAFKPWAAMWSLPAYAMAGLDAEIRSFFANNAQNYIVASRISQGNEDYKQASDEEHNDIEVRWLARKSDLKGFYAMKQRQKGKSRDQSPESQSQSPPRTQQQRGGQESEEEPRRSVWNHAKRVSTDEPPRNRLEEWRARRRRQTESATISSSSFQNDSASVLTMPTSPPPSSAGPAHERDDEFEQAIQAAVHETSTGDPLEDARIERAIRASVTALRKRSDTVGSGMTGSSNISGGFPGGGQQTSRSLIDSKQALPPNLPPRPSSQDLQEIQDLENITDEEYQALIEQAVQLSVLEQERQHRHRDSSDEDDEDFRRVLQRSQTELTISSNEQDDEEYRRVLEASHAEYANNHAHHQNHGEDDEEEALRKAIEASQAEQQRQHVGDGGHDDTIDEELRKAIEASEREHREKLALKTEEDIVMEYVKRQSLAEQQFGRSKGKQKVGSGSGGGGNEEEMDEDLRAALEKSRQLSGGGGGSGGGGSGATDNGGGSGSGR